MGGGISSQKLQDQESYVRKHMVNAREKMSKYKNFDGSNRYSNDQIKMKLRQDYNSKGYTARRIDRDSYISYKHWSS